MPKGNCIVAVAVRRLSEAAQSCLHVLSALFRTLSPLSIGLLSVSSVPRHLDIQPTRPSITRHAQRGDHCLRLSCRLVTDLQEPKNYVNPATCDQEMSGLTLTSCEGMQPQTTSGLFEGKRFSWIRIAYCREKNTIS